MDWLVRYDSTWSAALLYVWLALWRHRGDFQPGEGTHQVFKPLLILVMARLLPRSSSAIRPWLERLFVLLFRLPCVSSPCVDCDPTRPAPASLLVLILVAVLQHVTESLTMR